MVVDGDQIRRLARQVQAVADEARAVCTRLAAASGVQWQSVAADAFRRRLQREAAGARLAAQTVDRAALSLQRHAAALDAAGRLVPVPHLPVPHLPVPHLPVLPHLPVPVPHAAVAGSTAPGDG